MLHLILKIYHWMKSAASLIFSLCCPSIWVFISEVWYEPGCWYLTPPPPVSHLFICDRGPSQAKCIFKMSIVDFSYLASYIHTRSFSGLSLSALCGRRRFGEVDSKCLRHSHIRRPKRPFRCLAPDIWVFIGGRLIHTRLAVSHQLISDRGLAKPLPATLLSASDQNNALPSLLLNSNPSITTNTLNQMGVGVRVGTKMGGVQKYSQANGRDTNKSKVNLSLSKFRSPYTCKIKC